VFMTRIFNVTPKTTEKRLIVCSGKSKAEVTDTRRVHSVHYRTIKAHYTNHRIVQPVCDSRASGQVL